MNNEVVMSVQEAFSGLWADVVAFVPQVLVALVLLIIGWIVAGILKGVVVRLFSMLKVNEALDAAGVDELTERAGYKLNAGTFVGMLVKWFVISVFFVAALDVLRLDEVTMFVRDVVLGYLPQVIVAVLILVVSAVE